MWDRMDPRWGSSVSPVISGTESELKVTGDVEVVPALPLTVETWGHYKQSLRVQECVFVSVFVLVYTEASAFLSVL